MGNLVGSDIFIYNFIYIIIYIYIYISLNIFPINVYYIFLNQSNSLSKNDFYGTGGFFLATD